MYGDDFFTHPGPDAPQLETSGAGGAQGSGGGGSYYRETLRERSYEAHGGEVVLTSTAVRPAAAAAASARYRPSPDRASPAAEGSSVRRSARVVGLGLHLVRNDEVRRPPPRALPGRCVSPSTGYLARPRAAERFAIKCQRP